MRRWRGSRVFLDIGTSELPSAGDTSSETSLTSTGDSATSTGDSAAFTANWAASVLSAARSKRSASIASASDLDCRLLASASTCLSKASACFARAASCEDCSAWAVRRGSICPSSASSGPLKSGCACARFVKLASIDSMRSETASS